jgi:hypothetical protein
MESKMKISRVLGVLVVAAMATLAAQAAADVCKSPNLKIVNNKSETIKVTKLQYFDECEKKWREENLNTQEIEPGHFATFHDNLDGVGNCKISKFKLFRSVRANTGAAYGAPSWGGELVPDEGTTKCQTNVTFTIRAHD